MNRKQVLRMGVDLVITLSLLLLMAYELVGQAAHEWIGTAMVLLLIVHHILNRRWLAAIPQGRYTPYRVLQTTLVALILAAMAVQAVSDPRAHPYCQDAAYAGGILGVCPDEPASGDSLEHDTARCW